MIGILIFIGGFTTGGFAGIVFMLLFDWYGGKAVNRERD